MLSPSIGIIDYGTGNWQSIRNSFKKLGSICKVSDDPELLKKSDFLILPGVGAFKPAINTIFQKGLNQVITDHAKKGKPIIGICLGMQLLGISSCENGINKGLGLIKSKVVALGENKFHIGWNSIQICKEDNFINKAFEKDYFFNHSYAYKDEGDHVIATSVFKNIKFASIIRFNNIIGMQFHPEKSQDSGNDLLSSIIGSF